MFECNSSRRWGRITAAYFFAVILLFPLAPASAAETKPRLSIVTTFLPVYVFTINVVGDSPDVAVKLLVSSDVGCPHHYALRPRDLKAVADADIIIANGLDMEPFLPDLLKANPKAKVVTISDDCDVIRSAEHHHAPGEKCDHEHGVNGHVWTSPKEAIHQVRLLGKKLSEIDPEGAATYTTNSEGFVTRLQALDQRFAAAAEGFKNRRIVSAHDSLAYLARDLHLEVVATLETEPDQTPSAHEMSEIIETIKKTGAAAVFYEPSTSDRVARTVAHEAGVPAYPFNPFTSYSGLPTARSYEEVAKENLTVLQKALGSAP